MARLTEIEPRRGAATEEGSIGRIAVAVLVLAATLAAIWFGFIFLRDSQTTVSKFVTTIIAIIWGVGGVAALFFSANLLIEQFGETAKSYLRPFVFVGPAVFMLGWFLFLPTLRTIYLSFFNNDSTEFVGLQNYIFAFTDRGMIESFRNNLLWMFFGTAGCVIFGLVIAVLADRSKFESLAKAMIFMPMAISFVGAGVIWRFIYYYSPPGEPQIGLLNAIVTGLGGQPQAWTSLVQPWNNLFLVVIMIWLQTGFAMVIFSSAIKGIPSDILEASRVDGATEWQVFFQIMIPAIQSTIITVTTTIVIFSLKIFDVVIVMTGGQYGTHVIATQFYRQFFTNRDFGRGAAIAIILLIAVSPVIMYNLRQLNKQEGFR
ncbi:MAG: sugar ABC transporter permease [Kouleothrix sp.]|jgi:alpha-glucoside transport system permease protein|nr:sugar ABC transporter permease [Kouleothrix sp.]